MDTDACSCEHLIQKKQVARTAEVVFKAQWNHMLALLVCRAALSCLLLCCLASLLLWFFRNICGNPALS